MQQKYPGQTQTGDVVVHGRHLTLNLTPKPFSNVVSTKIKFHSPSSHCGGGINLSSLAEPTL